MLGTVRAVMRTAETVFVGDADSLIRAAREAEAATGTAEKRIVGSNAAVSKSFHGLGLAAVAGAGLLAVGLKKGADTTEELAKETLKLHNLTGLSVQSASAYASVAKVQDINARQLNMSFITLSKNVHAVETARSCRASGSANELRSRELREGRAVARMAHLPPWGGRRQRQHHPAHAPTPPAPRR
jgi:hypothetical protein